MRKKVSRIFKFLCFVSIFVLVYLFRFIIVDDDQNLPGPYFGYITVDGIILEFGVSQTGDLAMDRNILINEQARKEVKATYDLFGREIYDPNKPEKGKTKAPK